MADTAANSVEGQVPIALCVASPNARRRRSASHRSAAGQLQSNLHAYTTPLPAQIADWHIPLHFLRREWAQIAEWYVH